MKINRLLTAFVLSALLSSCGWLNTESEDKAYISVSLGRDSQTEIISKAAEPVTDLSQYSIDIIRETDGAVINTVPADEAESIEVPVGSYIVQAYNTAPNAGWDTPLYSGSQKVRLVKDQDAEVSITCFLANTKVTVSFDSSVTEMFPTYIATVSNGLGTPLIFGADEKTGYFAPTGSLSWSVTLTDADGINYQSAQHEIKDVKAKQHYHLSYKIKREPVQNGASVLQLVVDDSLTEKTYNLSVEKSEFPAPEISADFDFTTPIDFPLGSVFNKNIKFSAEAGIKQILFNHNQDDLVIPQWNSLYSSKDSQVPGAGFVLNFTNADMTEANLSITDLVSNLKIGEYTFYLTLIDKKNQYATCRFVLNIISSIEAEPVRVLPWAGFALLTAKWNTSAVPPGFKLQYKKVSDGVWMDCPGNPEMNSANKTAVLELYGLEPDTRYTFRAVTDKDNDSSVEIIFTTESNPQVPNMSFDNWYQNGKAWMPNISGQKVWDSANPGSATMPGVGVSPTTPEESIIAVSGAGKKAAKLQTLKVLTILAAGNIYTGQFSKIDGLGAELNWGYNFKSRPIALKGYLRYEPKTIENAKKEQAYLNGTMDQSSVKIFLTDWTSQFVVNTNKGTFLQDDDPSIIAMGALYHGSTNGKYIEFVIPIEYRNTEKIPTFITIGCAASRYGDYFIGGEGSTLYLDEFSLVYDPTELTEAQRQKVGYR